MSYLQQILSNAQQNGGLSDEEFNSIFAQFMPQQQAQPNMGLPQQQMPQQVQRPQGIPQTQVPMQWGTGVNTTQFSKGKPNGVQSDDDVGLMQNLADRYRIANEYDTDMFSEMTGQMAAQERNMSDDKEEKKGLLANFAKFFGQ